MNRIRIVSPFGLALLAVLVAACGSTDRGSSGASAKPNGVDRAFVADMVPHHESAIEMARIAQQRAQSPFVKDLASDIARAQATEISTMRAQDTALARQGIKKGDLGVPEHMTGMDADVGMLKTANPFDRAFIDMMVPHHQGAIVMARAELAKGGSPRLRRVATAIIAAQTREIKAMNVHRTQAFGASSPAGGVPAEGETTMKEHSGH